MEFSSPALAPVFVGTIYSPLHMESFCRPPSPPTSFCADEAAMLSGRPPPQEEVLFDLLRWEFSSPSLGSFFVGAISSPLRVESAKRPPLPLP